MGTPSPLPHFSRGIMCESPTFFRGNFVRISHIFQGNLRSKSLRVACDKFDLDTALRTSLSPYRNDGWLTNVPLWAIGQFEGLLG